MDNTKLSKIERDFIEALAETGNNVLMDLFLKWQTECNKRYLLFLKDLTTQVENIK